MKTICKLFPASIGKVTAGAVLQNYVQILLAVMAILRFLLPGELWQCLQTSNDRSLQNFYLLTATYRLLSSATPTSLSS